MFEVTGKFSTAKVFTSVPDYATFAQISELLSQSFMAGTRVRIMPDYHKGAGCVIGTTFKIVNGKIVPNLVGVDIGCGMHVTILSKTVDMNRDKLETVIRELVPTGFAVRNNPHGLSKTIGLENLFCFQQLRNLPRIVRSIGTLGGGNHFIEVDEDENNYYLVIHTGSRNLGKQVAEYYQKLAIEQTKLQHAFDKKYIAAQLKTDGKQHLIQSELDKMDRLPPDSLCYLSGDLAQKYLHDMSFCQVFANLNREAIASEICNAMGWDNNDTFTTMHNYIENHSMLRKGAVSAKKGERLIIPINMHDGAIIAIGKGNEDWNESAPHGAGRLLARGVAKRTLKMEDYEDSMAGIYTKSVSLKTLDESPKAYKPMVQILEDIKDTVDVVSHIRPIYSLKDSED